MAECRSLWLSSNANDVSVPSLCRRRPHISLHQQPRHQSIPRSLSHGIASIPDRHVLEFLLISRRRHRWSHSFRSTSTTTTTTTVFRPAKRQCLRSATYWIWRSWPPASVHWVSWSTAAAAPTSAYGLPTSTAATASSYRISYTTVSTPTYRLSSTIAAYASSSNRISWPAATTT